MTPDPFAPTVATILDPRERSRLDAAADGSFLALHAESVGDALRAVRERPVNAVLVSPRRVPRNDLAGVSRLARGFPGVSLVAVISAHDPESSERLFDLGASGVRTVVDLSCRGGWRRLREVVLRDASPTVCRILAQALPRLQDATSDCRTFFDVMVRVAPTTRTVRGLAAHLGVRASTFMSRFFRARLPSPKRYLAAVRLLHAAALFEVKGFSIADVAYRLDYSSPQSLGRHIKSSAGLTAAEFRFRYPFELAVADFVSRLILPFRATFSTFHPIETRGG